MEGQAKVLNVYEKNMFATCMIYGLVGSSFTTTLRSSSRKGEKSIVGMDAAVVVMVKAIIEICNFP
jgi:hypothetical protein